MSTAEVEQPSSTTQSSPQHLPIDDVEFTGFRPRSRHLSRTPVIVVDDDTPETGRNFVSLLQRTASMSRRPSATEQGIDDDNTVVVIEDAGGRTRGDLRTSNGAQTRPIVVLDSDDEQGQPLGSANATHRRRRTRASSSFRIFSPSPPPAQHHPVPPVPPLPPIIAEPLPFSVLPPPQRHIPARPRLPFDEPPQPVNNHGHSNNSGIHLGGGLLSQGNSSGRRTGPRTQIQFQSPANEMYNELIDEAGGPADGASIFTSFFASYFGGPPFIPRSGQTSSRGRSNVNPSGGRHLHEGLNFQAFGTSPGHSVSSGVFGLAAFSGLGPWGRRDTTLGLGPEYDKTMTHPERAGPGWTFDFGTEKEEGGSEVEGSEILVCAKCLDPLLANADGMVDVSEKEKKDRRVWGLRCGHILDGKCVDFLMMPERDRELAVEVNSVDIDPGSTSMRKRRRKGSGEHVEPDSVSENEVKGLVTTPDVKGKGKARASPANNPKPSPSDDREKLPSPNFEHADSTSSPDTSMLSRLRPRRNVVAPPPPSAIMTRIRCTFRPRRPPRQPAPVSSAEDSSSTRRRGAKRKRAASVTVEEIEERHEWTCPVSACGRVHVSIKMGGQWKMDPENGAVAIYV